MPVTFFNSSHSFSIHSVLDTDIDVSLMLDMTTIFLFHINGKLQPSAATKRTFSRKGHFDGRTDRQPKKGFRGF